MNLQCQIWKFEWCEKGTKENVYVEVVNGKEIEMLKILKRVEWVKDFKAILLVLSLCKNCWGWVKIESFWYDFNSNRNQDKVDFFRQNLVLWN